MCLCEYCNLSQYVYVSYIHINLVAIRIPFCTLSGEFVYQSSLYECSMSASVPSLGVQHLKHFANLTATLQPHLGTEPRGPALRAFRHSHTSVPSLGVQHLEHFANLTATLQPHLGTEPRGPALKAFRHSHTSLAVPTP